MPETIKKSVDGPIALEICSSRFRQAKKCSANYGIIDSFVEFLFTQRIQVMLFSVE